MLAGAVGGLIWLDRYQLFQVMISRPIVAAPVLGWLLGDLPAGVASGLLCELLWLSRPPVGGFIAPDVSLTSVATTAVAAGIRSASGSDLTAVVFLCFLVVSPVAFVGRRLDEMLRVALNRIAGAAGWLQGDGRDRIICLHFAAALALGFSLGFLLLVPVILCATFLLGHVVPIIPASLKRALAFGYYVVPLLGVVDLLVRMRERRFVVLFSLGFLAALLGSLILCR